MYGVLGHNSALTTWANEMNFVVNHVPGVGSIAQPVDQQSRALPLCYGCPLISSYDSNNRGYHNN